MKIRGEIEAAFLPTPIVETMKRMKASKPGSEVVVIEFTSKEVKVMRIDFVRQMEVNHWSASDLETKEKAELMHMIGIALKNSHRSNCTWFKSSASKMFLDATEFDKNSLKTILTSKGVLFLIIVYWGKWIGGEKENDRIISDESDGPLEDLGGDVLQ
jgi:hypothetical protein